MITRPYGRKLRRLSEVRKRCSRAGVEARKRKRLERNAGLPGKWPLVRSVLVSVYAAPDGRHVAMRAADGRGEVYACGSERATRGALARMLYRQAIQARASINHARAVYQDKAQD